MSRPIKYQAPPFPVAKWYGITGPISNDLPEEADLLQTRELIDTLKPHGVFEDDMELRHRESCQKTQKKSLYKEWLKEICELMNLPETVTANVGGKIFPFGSHQLGVHSKGRNIYSNMLGFLGGISWTILVARICQAYPNATAATLVNKFFKVLNMWEWPVPIMLTRVEDRYFNLPVWDPRVNPSDRCHLMPIITPAYPQQNTAFNVSHSTLAIITEEIQRGRDITEQIQKRNADWSKLFETPDFFGKYKHCILLKASSATERQHLGWAGLVESKLRHLVGTLERNVYISRAHVKTMDLTSDFLSFSSRQYLAKNCKIYEEGMIISATPARRENLSWQMPDGGHKSPVETTAPHNHTAPVSAGQPATERKGCLHPEMPAKRMKVDMEAVSVTNSSSVQVPTPCKPASPSKTPQATKRPRSPESEPSPKKSKQNEEPAPGTKGTCSSTGVSLGRRPSPSMCSPSSTKRPRISEPETPAKKFKFDLILSPVELSDLPPDPTKPATFVKRTMKIQFISRQK